MNELKELLDENTRLRADVKRYTDFVEQLQVSISKIEKVVTEQQAADASVLKLARQTIVELIIPMEVLITEFLTAPESYCIINPDLQLRIQRAVAMGRLVVGSTSFKEAQPS